MSEGPVTYEDFELNNFGKLRSLQIIDDIVEKRLRLVDVIECIGSVLTAESKEIRGRGIDFISWILARLPANVLSELELTHVARYFGDRLKDHHSLIPGVIKGIVSLVVQDRYNIYCIIEECAKNQVNCVQTMGPDFMFGVIAAMEGETDPKNLRLIFSFLPNLLTQLKNIDHLTSDIFEVFSTYFPVDFTSATKDGITITREDLAEGLSRCLSSTPSLAAECLPLILEKLDSSLKTAKIDSYVLLQQCCARLNVSQLEPSLGALWKMIRRDLIPPGPPAVTEEALRALTKIIGVLAKEESDRTSFNRFLDDVIISIRSLLPKPNDSLFIPSMKILEALCPESKLATSRVFLELEYLYTVKVHSSSDHQCLLAALLPFLRYHGVASSSLDKIAEFILFSAGNSCEDVRAFAFIALQRIISYLLDKEGRDQLYKVLLASAQVKGSSKSLNEYYKLLRKVAEYSPQSFFQEFYLPFFDLYQSESIPTEQFFEVVGYIADIPIVTSVAIPHILSCISSGKQSDLALKALLFACDSAKDPQFFTSLVQDHNLLSTLVVWRSEIKDTAVLSRIAEIVVLIVSHLEKEAQTPVVQGVMSTDPELFLSTIMNDPVKIILLEGLVGGLRLGVSIPSVQDVLRVALDIAKRYECPVTRHSAGRLLAIMVNKMPESVGASQLDEVIGQFLQPESDKGNFIALLSWLLKGALLRSLPGLDQWISVWFSYLRIPYLNRTYIQYKVVVPEMKEFTLCMWSKYSNHSNDHPLFSYAVRHQPKALAVWVSTTDRSNYFNMAVNGHTIFRLNYPIRLNRWYHSCSSWNGKTGEWQVWVNAERIGRGFHNLLVGHKIPGGGIAITGQEQRQLGGGFIEGPDAPKGSGGFLGEVTMVQLYKVALTAGKAFNDHRHHHSFHASTTPEPPPLPTQAPEEMSTPEHPFLENGQLKHKIPVFELAESLRNKDNPQQALDVPLPITGGVDLFNNPFAPNFYSGLDGTVLTPFMMTFPDHSLFKRNNGKTEDTRSKRNGEKSQGNEGLNADMKVKFVEAPTQVHVEKIKFTGDEKEEQTKSLEPVDQDNQGDEGENDSRQKREYVTVDEGKMEPEETERDGRRLRRPTRQNYYGVYGVHHRPRRPPAMRKTQDTSKDLDGHETSKRQVIHSDFGFGQFLPSGSSPSDDEDDGPIDPIEPAEGEVRRIMEVCSGCEPDPFRKVAVITWRSVPKKIYSGALFLKAKPECRKF